MEYVEYVEYDVCVVCVCVWSILCFNFVTTQKYTAMETEFKALQEKTDALTVKYQETMTRMKQVRVWCVCGWCVWCAV